MHILQYYGIHNLPPQHRTIHTLGMHRSVHSLHMPVSCYAQVNMSKHLLGNMMHMYKSICILLHLRTFTERYLCTHGIHIYMHTVGILYLLLETSCLHIFSHHHEAGILSSSLRHSGTGTDENSSSYDAK